MRSRLGTSALVAAVLTVSAACASGGGTEPRAAGSVGTAPAAAPAAETASAPAAPADPKTTAKTKTSGCNTAGNLEVCFSSPATHGGSDAFVVRHFIDIFKSAGAGDSLRIAMFRWDIPATTKACLLYTSPSPRDGLLSRMPSSA